MALTRTQYADSITKVGGYYNFVTIICRRLKELRNNQPPMLRPNGHEDEIDLIVREIDAGLLTLNPQGAAIAAAAAAANPAPPADAGRPSRGPRRPSIG